MIFPISNSSTMSSATTEMAPEAARDIDVIWASIRDQAATWRGASECQLPGLPSDRKKLWAHFAEDSRDGGVPPLIREFADKSSGDGKFALDLGCGNSVNAMYLLVKGWRVTAIDSSKDALKIFKDRVDEICPEWIRSGRLQIVEEDITRYVPPEPVDLIVAHNILPYINPEQFETTWKKIHETFAAIPASHFPPVSK